MTKAQFEEGLRVLTKIGYPCVKAIVRKEIWPHESFLLTDEMGRSCFTAYDKGIFENYRGLTAYIPYDEIIALKY